jgi:hypothetical protein
MHYRINFLYSPDLVAVTFSFPRHELGREVCVPKYREAVELE